MTDSPSADQRILLDAFDNIPTGWEYDVTYPSMPDVDHCFPSYPELVLTHVGDTTTEVAVRAIITNGIFHGYAVTTNSPDTGIITAACADRRLTSLTHEELTTNGVDTTHHPGVTPTSDDAVEHALSLSAAVSLATYYSTVVNPTATPAEETAHTTAQTTN